MPGHSMQFAPDAPTLDATPGSARKLPSIGDFVVLGTVMVAFFVCFAGAHGTSDVNTFYRWSIVLQQQGIFGGYGTIRDYPPLGPALLRAAAAAGRYFGVDFLLSLKGILALAEAASSAIVLWWLRSAPLALLMYVCIAPFGVLLGYIDALYVPPLLACLILAERRRFAVSMLCLAVASSIKWQPIILAPGLLAYVFSQCGGWRDALRQLTIPATYAACILLMFGSVNVFMALFGAVREPIFSGNAINLDWILSYALEAGQIGMHRLLPTGEVAYIEPHLPHLLAPLSKLAFFSAYGLSLALFLRSDRSFRDLLICCLTGYICYFMFNTGVHENHLFIGVVLALLAYGIGCIDPMILLPIVILGVINPILFYGLDGDGLHFSRVTGVDGSLLFAPLGLIAIFRLFRLQVQGLTLRQADA